MSITWEKMSSEEIKAEAEAILDYSGQSKLIKESLYNNSEIQKWREEIFNLCKIEMEKKSESMTPDELYQKILKNAKQIIPKNITQDIEDKLTSFFDNKLEEYL